jgi:hypothetical protein
VVAEPDQVAPEIVRRYGDLLTRVTLYPPCIPHPQIAEGIRAAAPAAGARA